MKSHCPNELKLIPKLGQKSPKTGKIMQYFYEIQIVNCELVNFKSRYCCLSTYYTFMNSIKIRAYLKNDFQIGRIHN